MFLNDLGLALAGRFRYKFMSGTNHKLFRMQPVPFHRTSSSSQKVCSIQMDYHTVILEDTDSSRPSIIIAIGQPSQFGLE